MKGLKPKFVSRKWNLTLQNPLWSNDRGKLNEIGTSAQLIIVMQAGTAEPGGLGGGFSPPTVEEDDIFFVFVLVYVYFTLYPG